MSSATIRLFVVCLCVHLGRSSHYAQLNTYVIGGDEKLSSAVFSSKVNSQLAPVYKKQNQIFATVLDDTLETTPTQGLSMVTKTVYGFQDFTTTVGSTVMVFTPQSEGTKSLRFKPEASQKPNRPFKKTNLLVTQSPQVVIATEIPSPLNTSPKEPPTGLARLLQQALVNSQKSKQRSLSGSSRKNKYQIQKKTAAEKRKNEKPGGITLTPITVQGTGSFPVTAPSLQSSIYVPEEVVVRASHGFPPISAVASLPRVKSEYRTELRSTTSSSKVPTGLVTTLGGTTISGRLTTVHATSVIGTYVNGKYAQILSSTTRIFKDKKEDELTPTYQTVKQVIEGTATQFFTPKSPESLPIESLFSSVAARSPRHEDPLSLQSKLTKRRGANPLDYGPPFQSSHGRDDDDDLQRSGSDLRATFRHRYDNRNQASERQTNTRPRFRPSGTRNAPPPFRRTSGGTTNRRLVTKFREAPVSKPKYERKEPTRHQESQRPEKRLPAPPKAVPVKKGEETVRVKTIRPQDGPTNVYSQIIIMRSLHPFKLGSITNTRYVTYSKTVVKTDAPKKSKLVGVEKKSVETPLFENILQKKNNIATLPPIDIGNKDLHSVLQTTTETYKTTETMYKTSVLPVKSNTERFYHTLVQTFYITRVVSAIKTIPPVEAFEFVPADSFSEFNDRLLAEGTENEAALLPGEQENDGNSEARVRPPQGFQDPSLADIAGGKFNPDAIERPEILAAINNQKQNTASVKLDASKNPAAVLPNGATPALTPEQLQMAYLRLYNPYMFGGVPSLPGQQPLVTSSPVVITTDVTETSTRVLRVIFNARPISTTITTVSVVRTTLTTYSTQTLSAPQGLPGFPGLPYPPPFAG